MKKILSLTLVGSMILSSMSMAFAATPATTALKDIAGNDYEQAIEALVALDVVNGYEDNTFRPAKTITRAELAKLLVEALGYGNLVAGAASNFSDTQGHWANGYVAIANGTGLVIGYPDGTFQPDKVVTYDEAYTMIIRALGYTDAAVKGTWPTNYKVKAIDLGLTDDVKMATSAADRGGVAQSLYNALEAVLVTVDSENKITNETKTVDGKESNKILLDKIATYDSAYVVSTATLDEDSKFYGGDIVDLENYMYQSLEVYLNDDDEVVFVKDTNSVVVEGTVDDVNGTLDIKDAAGKIHEIPLTTTSIYYNGAEKTGFNMNEITDNYEKVTVVGFEDKDHASNFNDKIDKDSEIVGVVAKEQTFVDLIDNVYKTDRTYIDDIDLPEDDGDVDLDNITVTGAVDSLSDIEVDDVVVAYESMDGSVIELVVVRDTVEGKVTRLADGAVYVGGTKYDISETKGAVTDAFKLGDNGTFFLDNNGDIVAFEGASVEPTDYAVVVNYANGVIEDNSRYVLENEFAVDKYPMLKLATQEDETVSYEVFVEVDEDDGTIDDVATYENEWTSEEDLDLVNVAAGADDVIGDGDVLALDYEFEAGDIVKYSLNEDGQIDAITVVKSVGLDVDTTTSTFKLVDGAIVFDSSDDYAVADADQLDEYVSGYGVYNDNGELEVIVTADIDQDEDDTVYAILEDIYDAYDADEEEVQAATAFISGEEKDLLTDGSDDTDLTAEGVYALELDGDVITKATLVEEFYLDEVTAISTRNNMVQIDGVWYAVAEDATIVEYVDGDVEFRDLYDFDEGDYVYFLLNGDDEVSYMEFTVAPEAPVVE